MASDDNHLIKEFSCQVRSNILGLGVTMLAMMLVIDMLWDSACLSSCSSAWAAMFMWENLQMQLN